MLTVHCLLPTTAPKVYIYDSLNTNNTYIFNSQRVNQSTAESYCQDQGGHLVSYV